MNPTRLEVYDFDWTLFRSPCSPPGRTDWWASMESIVPPNVPHQPSGIWWVEDIAQQAAVSSQRKDTITVIITGRRRKFATRIAELAKQVGIEPTYIYCYDSKTRGPEHVVAYKIEAIESLLQQYPYIEELIVYEDLPAQLVAFKELADHYGIKYEGNIVTARMEANLPWGC